MKSTMNYTSILKDIEERNDWGDTFWGTVDGAGENHLGKILMEIGDERIKNV